MLQLRAALAYDLDCYTLHACANDLFGHAQPDSRLIVGTPFNKRGQEISDAVHGSIIPCHLDPEHPRRSFPSLVFQMVHDRVPKPGGDPAVSRSR